MKGKYIFAALSLIATGASIYYFRQLRNKFNKMANQRLQQKEIQGEKHIREVMRKSKLAS